jgi:hypothetical protein
MVRGYLNMVASSIKDGLNSAKSREDLTKTWHMKLGVLPELHIHKLVSTDDAARFAVTGDNSLAVRDTRVNGGDTYLPNSQVPDPLRILVSPDCKLVALQYCEESERQDEKGKRVKKDSMLKALVCWKWRRVTYPGKM